MVTLKFNNERDLGFDKVLEVEKLLKHPIQNVNFL